MPFSVYNDFQYICVYQTLFNVHCVSSGEASKIYPACILPTNSILGLLLLLLLLLLLFTFFT